MLRVGRYSVCILDLLTDSRNGRLSASKLWLHIGNGIMSWIMLQSDSVDWELLTAYGGIVGGSYVAILFFKLRYSGAAISSSSGDSGMDNSELDELAERVSTVGAKRTAKPAMRGGSNKTKGGKR